MQIIISENKETWDNFLLENDGSFLQSWDWGEFQLRQAKKVWRLQAKNKQNKIVCEAQVLKEAFPLNKSMLYIPLGPCFKSTLFLKDKKKILNLILKFLKKIAKREGSIFAKVESPVFLPKIENLFPSKRRIQPKRTMVLSLLPQEEEILKKFHSKTRYNIKIAEKKGVNFIKLQNKKEKLDNLNFFWKILQKTARRGKFKTYSRDYYQDMLSFDSTTLYLGQYKKKIIVGHIMVYFGKRAVYLHGASDYKYRKLMAPHFLHWWQICDAKGLGYEKYDFGGSDDKKWPGLTRFKKGFGTQEIEYPQGKDFPFQKIWYKVYILMKKRI